jgi:hypothetical protein
MAEARISQERLISAPAGVVYDCLADYTHYPRILPDAFTDFRVERGGRGGGTIITFRLKAAGSTRSYRGEVTEPEPGRVLSETYTDGAVTSFYVEPQGDGTQVRIETRWQPRGIRGVIERLLSPRILLPLYAEELENLEAYARARVSAG